MIMVFCGVLYRTCAIKEHVGASIVLKTVFRLEFGAKSSKMLKCLEKSFAGCGSDGRLPLVQLLSVY